MLATVGLLLAVAYVRPTVAVGFSVEGGIVVISRSGSGRRHQWNAMSSCIVTRYVHDSLDIPPAEAGP